VVTAKRISVLNVNQSHIIWEKPASNTRSLRKQQNVDIAYVNLTNHLLLCYQHSKKSVDHQHVLI